ncbi:MAG: proline--tRNA ligase [Candidatus Nanoarchaeia archaeon]|nr:proline--tRNA ligase [Candidatus Nanoarchaeia archaeon]
MKEKQIGITVKKEDDSSEWYTQVIQRADLIEYTKVSGCYVLKPNAYAIWEIIQKYFDAKIKKSGVKNAYFPLLIPESLLKKESKHIEGFSPEVAWVTHAGDSKLDERLAIRPTSETIMYDSYSKWIRSHKDLPLRLNQWCNVVRWEFKNPVPFLRSREFLWQEGHTAFATKKEADEEAREILKYYKQVLEELLAVPMIEGIKSEKEKFAGADYTLSIETFLPTGKAIQGATSHGLGQNFSKVFNISFLDEENKKQYVWQNSWGLTTRTIGVMIMMHSDNKGLVLPPRVALNKVVIVPIIFENTKEKVLKVCDEIKKELSKHNPILDDRDDYSAGWKFSDWELKGIPIRIELGPKDLENKEVILVRRDTHEKIKVKIKDLSKKIDEILEEIQANLFNKAKKFLDSSIVEVDSISKLKDAVKNKKMGYAPWCGSRECEETIKAKADGAKSLNIPFNQKDPKKRCFACEGKAKYYAYFAKSY